MKKNPVVHFEMPYKDAKRVSSFYTDVFGWEMNVMGEDMGNYITAQTTETENRMVKTPGTINGGFFKSSDQNVAAVVISVDDIQDAIKKVKEAGGEVLGDVVDIPGVGRYIGFNDTEGNRVSLLEPSHRMR